MYSSIIWHTATNTEFEGLNTNLVSEACIIKFIMAMIYSLRNKLEGLSLASLSSLV
jgi:hypothetical protein